MAKLGFLTAELPSQMLGKKIGVRFPFRRLLSPVPTHSLSTRSTAGSPSNSASSQSSPSHSSACKASRPSLPCDSSSRSSKAVSFPYVFSPSPCSSYVVLTLVSLVGRHPLPLLLLCVLVASPSTSEAHPSSCVDTKFDLPIRLAWFWSINYLSDLITAFLAVGLLKLRSVHLDPLLF
jgi:hypothetical protein